MSGEGARGLLKALQANDDAAFDKLLWTPPSQPIPKVEVVVLGVVKKVVPRTFVAFDFRLRLAAPTGAMPAGQRISWSCVFPLKPDQDVPAEAFLHLPHKQKFTASQFLEGKTFAAGLDSILADAGIKADTPGAAVMVIDHGKVVLSKCVGLANLKEKRAITPETTFDLCSTSKHFTGAAILRLYEQGKLKLDDDIRKFVPEMPVYDAKNPVRILNLARHTSGLPDFVDFPDVKSKDPKYLTNEDYAGEFARQQKKFPLVFPTGQGYRYNNTNFMILALIVERVSGQSFSAFMKKEFFDPLGMKTAGVNETPKYMPPNPALGYHKEKDAFQFTWGPASITHARLLPVGHGGVWASLDDMARWEAGWRQGKIIKPATQKQAIVMSKYGDSQDNDYAFGWGLTAENGKLLSMAHNGSFAGFLTYMDRNLAEDRTLVVLCNVDSLDVNAIVRLCRALPPKGKE